MDTVSIVCVYNNNHVLSEFLLKSLKIQKMEYDLILIDNRNNKFSSAAAALNYGAKKAKGDYLVFAHQDIKIDNPCWIEETINQIKLLDNPGIVGIAGKTNDRFIRTNIKHGIPPNIVSFFNLEKVEIASTVDECIFIIPRKVFDILQFDEKTCFDWHLYATDYSLAVSRLGFNAYLIPSELIHASKGSSMSESYYKTLSKIQKKYLSKVIFRNCMGDWYNYIPINFQKRCKEIKKQHKVFDLFNFIDDYYVRNNAENNYHQVDEDTYNLVKESGLFDFEYYSNKYGIDYNKYDLLTHYLTVGYLKNYNPSSKFNTRYYRNRYWDIKHLGINPLEHYLKWGFNEGRIFKSRYKSVILEKIKHKILNSISNYRLYLLFKSKFNLFLFFKYLNQYNLIKNSKLFDEDYYLNSYPKVMGFKNQLILHYMFLGYGQGYKPNNFMNCNYYLKKYDNNNPIVSYLQNESDCPIEFNELNPKYYDLIEKSELFDEEYYLNNYPDVEKYSEKLIEHYYYIGFKKGYNPSKNFYTDWYLLNYPEVRNNGINPLIHYLLYGKYENKITKPIDENEAKKISDRLDVITGNEKLIEFGKDDPLVSIIILTHNGIDYLKKLFENFEENVCYPNYEIIVVDNDSDDGTYDYLKSLSFKLPIRIIKNKINETFSKANNKATQEANGEFILLLNNDVEPLYGWLNHMMNIYLKSKNVGVVGAKLIYPFFKDSKTSLRTQHEGIKFTELNGFLEKNDGYVVPYNIKENNVFCNEEDYEIGAILGAALLIRKDLYWDVGGLDENYIYNYEDIDLCFKIIKEGYKVIYSPKAKLYHYYQATRKESFDLSPKDMNNRIYLFRKWNKWLCEKLFIDRLENNLIFSENPLNITYNSTNHDILDYDNLINFNSKEHQSFKDNHMKFSINGLGWEVSLIHLNSNISLKNTDIFISDIPMDLTDLKIFNKHQVNVAVIIDNLDIWSEMDLSNFDIILVNEENLNYFDSEKTYILNENSIFLQIKKILTDIHKFNLDEFNKILKNYDFEDAIPWAKNYMSIHNSEYFDKEWYEKTYNISSDNLDSINHYLQIGWKIGYNPSPSFNGDNYLDANPDVRKANMNPLLHFELYGKYENRQLSCTKNELKSYDIFLSMTNSKNYEKSKKSIKTNNRQILFYSPWSDRKDGPLSENCQLIYDNLDENYEKKVFTYKYHNHIGDNLELLYDLLESKLIIIDQGWDWLSQFELKDNQKVINIWHAAGAFKKIGYDVPIYSNFQIKMFGKQFSQYSNFIVSSPKLKEIYANAHGMDKKDVLSLGVPRTDIFFDESLKQNILDEFYYRHPNLKDKELILYAPTFRDDYILDPKIDWDLLSNSLDANECFIIKRHILTSEDILYGKKYDNILYLDDESIFALMLTSKLLITDYSSSIFDYALLNKPIIHYCPDLEDFISIRDFYLNFYKELYGDIIENSNDLINIIKEKRYEVNIEKLRLFKAKFMSSCDGKSTERIIRLIDKYMKEDI